MRYKNREIIKRSAIVTSVLIMLYVSLMIAEDEYNFAPAIAINQLARTTLQMLSDGEPLDLASEVSAFSGSDSNPDNTESHDYTVDTVITVGETTLLSTEEGDVNDGGIEYLEDWPVFDYNNCNLPLGTGYCSPRNLSSYFAVAGISNSDLLGDKFSRICQRESGSDPSAFNNLGLVNESVDVSAGFFQMNAIAHCPWAFADAYGNPGTSGSFNPYAIPVSIIDGPALVKCIEPIVFVDLEVLNKVNPYLPYGSVQMELDDPSVELQKANASILNMIDLYNQAGLQPWSMGSRGCSIR